MAMANNKTQCFKCSKDKITYPCRGCSNEFCLTHLNEHQQILSEELNHIINDYDEFKQKINEQKQNPYNPSFIEQINQWETDSIEKIQQKAKDCREDVIKSSQTFINDVEIKFKDLTEQIKQIHEENEFNEMNLNYLKNQLLEITEELKKPSNISIRQNSKSFIPEISVILPKSKFNKWKQNAITVDAGNGKGQELNQLNSPCGTFIDENKNVFIAEFDNHRIIEWKCNAKEGQLIAGGNGKGNRMDQLNNPTDVIINQHDHSIIIADKGNRRVVQWFNQNQQILIQDIDCYGLAMDKNGFLYVSDVAKNEVRRWKIGESNEGIIVAGGNGTGDKLNQFNNPTFIFVDEDQSVYVSDRDNHRVMKWTKDAKEGRIVAGGNGNGRNLNQLSAPRGVIVDHSSQIYVVDCENDRVMRWCEGKEEGEIVVGGNGKGNQLNQLNGPRGLSFDDDGNLYICDQINHRIEKFEIIL
ncbi:unnamed protein product [Adineta steineri]|uniref:Uncharacterized protein n=1 Tax=Adineta steineri TaxID=433720 RepID=A0A814DGQ8_9BILA|nr:unnamed protein product [Adineta steineri]CAF3610608.1 unnamed protein product [Adineta steineri]